MSKAVIRLSFLLLVFSGLADLQPRAAAGCFTPHSRTTTYYAYVDATGGFYGCTPVIIGPGVPFHWAVIGEQTVACDGTVSSWGDTTSCTKPANTVRSSQACGQVCQ
ncbi:MAG: hypothetical protein M3O15_15180 [Acidobacteriota bacterium]|nr:hypothetical protein [Acidobacteriota bacterium]